MAHICRLVPPKRKFPRRLVDAVLALQRANIIDDIRHIRRRKPALRRHVAKRPVMRTHAPLDSHQERHIPMMARLIYFVHQRRAHTQTASGILAMAVGADSIKRTFAHFLFRGQALGQCDLDQRRALRAVFLRNRLICAAHHHPSCTAQRQCSNCPHDH